MKQVDQDRASVELVNPGAQTNSEGEAVNLRIELLKGVESGNTYGALDLPAGLTIDASSGKITGTVDFDTKSTYSTVVTVRNQYNNSANISFEWHIRNVNRAPVIGPLQDVVLPEGTSLLISPEISDPDGQIVTLSIDGGATFAKLVGNTIQLDTGFRDAGTYVLSVGVTDNDEVPLTAATTLKVKVTEAVAASVDISQNTNSDMSNYSIHTNKRGDILVIWMQSGGAATYHYNYFSGNTRAWAGAKQFLTDSQNVNAIGTSDRFIIAWVQLDGLYVSEFMDGGFRGSIKQLDTSILSTSPITFMQSQDHTLVEWSKKDTAGATSKYASVHTPTVDGGSNIWSAPIGVSSTVAGDSGFVSAAFQTVGGKSFLSVLRFSNSTSTWGAPLDIGLSAIGGNLRTHFSSGTYFAIWTENIALSTAHSAHSRADGTWVDDGLLGPTGYTVGIPPTLGTSPAGLAVVWLSNDYGVLYSNIFRDGAWRGHETLSTTNITPPTVYGNSNSLLSSWGYGNPVQFKQFMYFTDQAKWGWSDSFYINNLEDQHNPDRTIVSSTNDDYFIVNPYHTTVIAHRIHSGIVNSMTLDDGAATKPTAINAIANSDYYAVVWRRTNSSGLNDMVASTYYKNKWLDQPNILGGADGATANVRLVKSREDFCAFWLVTRQDNAALHHIRSVCGF